MQLTVALALVSLPAVLFALRESRRGNKVSYILWKAAASAIFLVAAHQAYRGSRFELFLLCGLWGHAVGDILIAWPGTWRRTLFVLSIGGFLAGHILYFLAFQSLTHSVWDLGAAALFCSAVVNYSVFVLVRKRLGRLAIPGFFYTTALVLMSSAGISRGLSLGSLGGLTLAAGAVMYNGSDAAVVRERFVQSSFTNKIWGLPLYYLAQYTLIVSMSLL